MVSDRVAVYQFLPGVRKYDIALVCICPCFYFVQGVMAVYIASAGWMMVFVHVVAMLGTVFNGMRQRLPIPSSVVRLLRSRKVAAAAVCAVFIAAHVETFALPPTFREVTLKGELSAFQQPLVSRYVSTPVLASTA